MGSPPTSRGPRSALLVGGTAAVLTLLFALLGGQPWPLPTRTTTGWQVAGMSQSLATFLVLAAVVCLGAAGSLVRPLRSFRTRGAAIAWWGVVVLAALSASSRAARTGRHGSPPRRPPGSGTSCG